MTSKSLSVATALSLLALTPLATARAQEPSRLPDGVQPSSSIETTVTPGAAAADETRARLLFWNRAAIDASGLDHTRPGPEDDWTFGQQLGPGRSSRALAIVQIAVFEAVNAIAGGSESYAGVPPAKTNTSMDAAIAFAARDTLIAMFPSQTARIDALLFQDVARMNRKGRMFTDGIATGHAAASAVLAMRAGDGSGIPEPLVDTGWPTSDAPGHWRQDPISRIPLALGAHWGEVTPFVLTSADQFRVPPPPSMLSPEYTSAYNEVLQYGGETSALRTDDQTEIGIYWAYDGTPSLCAPPRLYNQITATIADLKGTDTVALARLLALVNTSMADAGIAIWESKYHYDFWRPITGIREADPGTGPTGAGDGNPDTVGDPAYVPLCAPASNSTGPNFTPPFPAYPSGHAGFGGALFQTLRRFYGTDDIPFTFVSDEFNGVTQDNEGNVRELRPRSFATLSQAEEENGQSRIYLGIHWAFDKTAGIAQGRQIADWVFEHAFQAKPGKPPKN